MFRAFCLENYKSDFPEISAEKILHIGDKFDADVASPKSLGINAIHYDVLTKGLEKSLNMKGYAKPIPSILIRLGKLPLIFLKILILLNHKLVLEL